MLQPVSRFGAPKPASLLHYSASWTAEHASTFATGQAAQPVMWRSKTILDQDSARLTLPQMQQHFARCVAAGSHDNFEPG